MGLHSAMCIAFCFVVFASQCASSSDDSLQTIDNIQILESLSELMLQRHYPDSLEDTNNKDMNKKFTSFVQNLKHPAPSGNENFTCPSDKKTLHKFLCQNETLPKCISVEKMVQLLPPTSQSISEALARVCPLLILQLHNDECSKKLFNTERGLQRPSPTEVWGYGLLFVTLISLCSLVGVILLPLLSKNTYHVMLMVFEGLAVGSLAGSSLFHLIPQTFHLIGKDSKHDYLWKSLIIFCGIYLFYMSERLMKIIITVKEQRKKVSFEENSTDTLESHQDSTEASQNGSIPRKLQVQIYPKDSPNGIVLTDEKVTQKNGYCLVPDMSNIQAQNNNHHSHHHDHAVHFEKGQSPIATVAWMIIFGDGLHNFIDGLSIGAAFSESVLAGISISVAVICEEFPHELGDFAVLLSAGMTMRQALMYNFLSAITCYAGLIFGVLLGDLAEGAPYIFALAAGMFLYISLVDMMGELGEAIKEAQKKGPSAQLKVLFIQNIGILIGVAVLFVMARYAEHFNFKNIGFFAPVTNTTTDDDHLLSYYSGLQEAKQTYSMNS